MWATKKKKWPKKSNYWNDFLEKKEHFTLKKNHRNFPILAQSRKPTFRWLSVFLLCLNKYEHHIQWKRFGVHVNQTTLITHCQYSSICEWELGQLFKWPYFRIIEIKFISNHTDEEEEEKNELVFDLCVVDDFTCRGQIHINFHNFNVYHWLPDCTE